MESQISVLDQLRVVPVLHAEQRAQHHADQAVQQLRQQRRVEELEERQRRRRRRWRWRRDAEAAEEVGYHLGGVVNCAERRWRRKRRERRQGDEWDAVRVPKSETRGVARDRVPSVGFDSCRNSIKQS